MTRQRYSAKESFNRILRLFQGKAAPSDAPETLSGEILSEDGALSDLAELFAGSLPNETATLPSAITVPVGNIPANTFAPYYVTGTTTAIGYSITATDELIVCNSTSALTVALPAASGSGKKYSIANINTGQVTLDGLLSETINGETTQLIDQWACLDVVDYALGKWVII